MNFKEFFIDYKDNLNEQKFIYYSGILNKTEHEFKYSNNEEKIGWYHIQKNVMFQEKPFISSILLEYIVYDKKTKKVKFKLLNEKSKSLYANNAFKQYFLKSVLSAEKYNFIFDKLIILAFNKTFVKRIIENKINNLNDIINYIIKHVVKIKNINSKDYFNLFLVCYHIFDSYTFNMMLKNWKEDIKYEDIIEFVNKNKSDFSRDFINQCMAMNIKLDKNTEITKVKHDYYAKQTRYQEKYKTNYQEINAIPF